MDTLALPTARHRAAFAKTQRAVQSAYFRDRKRAVEESLAFFAERRAQRRGDPS